MKTCASLVVAILVLMAGMVGAAPAEVVGRLTQVEGRVDVLKAGKLPAAAGKLEDQVEPGDVLRTKSLSKAQITFIDNTVVTISPESRLAIDEYVFDPAKGKRNAVLQLFQGVALAVVSKIFKVEQPDFVLKTHTAIMGVRGTEVGVRLSPNDSTFMNFQGQTRVANIFPEVSGDLFRKAAKVAFSFTKGYVDLGDMQGTSVARGLPPTLPFVITNEDRQMFMRQMVVTPMSSRSGGAAGAASCPVTAAGTGSEACGPATGGAEVGVFPAGFNAPGGLNPDAPLVAGVTIPPTVVPVPEPTPTPTPTPTPVETIVFSQSWSGPVASNIQTQPTTNFVNTGPGSGASSAVTLFPNGFTVSNLLVQATLTSPSTIWTSGWRGTFNTTANGSLSGPLNGSLSGTMNMTISIPSDITFTLSGPITYNAGTLTYTFGFNSQLPNQNIFNFNGGNPQGFVNTGSWTQIATTLGSAAASQALVQARGTQVRPQLVGPLGTRMTTQLITPQRR